MNNKATLSKNTYYSLICNVCGQTCAALAYPQEGWSHVCTVDGLKIAAENAKATHEAENPGHSVRLETKEATGKALAEEEKDERSESVCAS